MRSAALALMLIGLAAVPLGAQGRGRWGNQGIPPGQMPPAGMCRVWYDGRPPGQQPRAMNCDQAERTAARDPNARVVYGPRDNRTPRNYPNDNRYPDNRYPYPDNRYPDNRYPNGGYPGGGYGSTQVPYSNGFEDGYDKGVEDARDNDNFDPTRHSWYRSGDRGYNSRYGTRTEYRNVYRDGFRAGYEEGYRTAERNGNGSTPRRSGRWPWFF